MTVIFVSSGAVLVVSASGAISEFKHLRACNTGQKSTNECRLIQPAQSVGRFADIS